MGFSVSPTDYAILEQKIGKQAAADMARREGWQVVLPEGGFAPMSAMGGGNDVEDDEYYQDDEQTAALPPVGGLNAVDPYAADELAQEAISTQLRANMARIEKGMQRLRERRMGPTSSEKWLSIAAALGQPTKTGAFGESLGNLARSLAETKSAQREAEEKRDALLEKYGMDLSTEQLRLLMANASRTSQAARAAAAANKPKPDRWVSVPQGGSVVNVTELENLPTYTAEEVIELRKNPANRGKRFLTTDKRLMEL
jgi:hypothetical protein